MVTIEKIEGVCYEIRLGDNHFKHGDPYSIGLIAKVISDEEVEFRLMSNPISKDEMRQVREMFESLGFSKLTWQRRKKGETHRRGIH